MQLRKQRKLTQIDLEEAIETAGRRSFVDTRRAEAANDGAAEVTDSLPWIDREAFRAEAGLLPVLFTDELHMRPGKTWLVDEHFQMGEAALVWGPRAQGKSTWMQDLMVCVGYGIPFHGIPVARRLVIYVCAEGMSGADERIIAARAKYEKLDGEEPAIIVYERPVDLMRRMDTVNKELERLKETILALIRHSGLEVGVIIFDTLAKCCGDGDENSTRDMNAVIRGLQQDICEPTGAAAILVAHAGKDISRGPRGASSLEANCSTSFCVAKEDDDDVITITCKRQKECKEVEPVHMVLEEMVTAHPRTGQRVSAPVVRMLREKPQPDPTAKLTDHQRLALTVLSEAGGELAKKEWAKRARAAGLNPDRPAAFNEAAKALIKAGLVQVEGETCRTA
jgi:hypothetical protein